MSEASTATATVTRKELLALAEAEKRYREASAESTAAEKLVKMLRLSLAEKVLGVDTSDQWKRMAPDAVAKIMESRERKGYWEAVRGAPKFRFEKTSEGCYPAWKAVFVAFQGEAAADRIAAETPTLYSYRVEVDS